MSTLEGFLEDLGPVVPNPLQLSPSAKDSVQKLLSLASPLEEQAMRAGIPNIFEDGAFRTLLIASMFDLSPLAGKLGDDAVDKFGRYYELKTVSTLSSSGWLRNGNPGVTTAHTLRQSNIDRYRESTWLVGVFQRNTPLEVWQVNPQSLEGFFARWEKDLEVAPNHELNNPKIPLSFIRSVGINLWVGA